jgi:photosystem II stability/assembly factor-like uncharacterized protein
MRAILSSLGLFVLGAVAFARHEDPHKLVDPGFPHAWNSALQWRAIGPANMGGRISAVAVVANDPCTYWIGTASGGLLKTTNAGLTYEHQFDHETTVSVGDVAVAPSNPEIVWVGTGEANPRNSVSYGDGVYRSIDGGKNWKRMGLEKTYQIGRILIHPTNPDIVYVGALGRLYGPNEDRGVFKTTDGGKSWEKVLYVDEHTGVIDIDMDPRDPETLLVATYERERDLYDSNDPKKKWGPGGGIQKTTDGGRTWRKITSGLPEVQLGRIGIDWYQKDPNVVFAIVETERIARVPDDAGYLGLTTEDAEIGARVRRVAEGSPAESAGLKEKDIVLFLDDQMILTSDALARALREHKAGDKIELQYVREKQRMRAEIELAPRPPDAAGESPFSSGLGGQVENVHAEQGRGALDTGGVFRSADSGETWARVNSLNPRPMYFSQIRVDPSDERYLYVLGISLYRSEDGGATFKNDGHGPEVHVDHHMLWIDPRDGRHMFLGNDGGFYVTNDRMKTWDYHNHMAIGQFYSVALDSRRDYHAYGGLQDNGSWGGPTRTSYGEGPINTDWVRIGGGDGFVCAVDPEDPDLIYYESQNGGMGRIDFANGGGGFMRPRALKDVRYRFNWKTPFVLSSHNSRMFYCAGSYVFRSLDRGEDMDPISPTITRTDEGSATAIAESRHTASTLYVGTDDGALWRSTDFGASWVDLFDADAPARTLAAEEAERERIAAEKKAAEEAEKKAAKEKEKEAKALEKKQKEEQEAAAAAAAASADALSGSWKGKLRGEGLPESSSEFRLSITRDASTGVVSVELVSEKLTAKGSAGSFDPATGALEIDLQSDTGSLHLSGKLDGEKMSGKLRLAGGLFEIEYQAEREPVPVPPEPPPVVEDLAPPPAPVTPPAPAGEPPAETASSGQAKSDALAGEWSAALVGDQAPPGATGFRMLLERAADGKVSGSTSSERGDGTIESASFDAATGALTMTVRTERGTVQIEAKVEGEKMTGVLTVGGGAFRMDFAAERAKAAPESGAPPAPAPAPAAEPTAAEQPAAAQEPPPSTEPAPGAEPAPPATSEPAPEKKLREHSIGTLLPKPMCVSSIEPSHHEAKRVYVTFDGHRSDDDQPWVLVSEDEGDTWANLGADLPRGSARVVREDPINENVLWLGTEFGAFLSVDRGKTWTQLDGEFPTVAVHDFAFSSAVPEAVLATHGRSLWVLDVSPIRQMTEEVLEKNAWLFAPESVVRTRRLPDRGDSGTRRFVGKNPGTDASIYYFLRERAKDLKISILEPTGELVRELEEPPSSLGLHRVSWDLRRAGRSGERGSRGRSVPSGRYQVVLELEGVRLVQPITIEDSTNGSALEEEIDADELPRGDDD